MKETRGPWIRKAAIVTAIGVMFSVLTAGCVKQKFPGQEAEEDTDSAIKIVTTNFAAYDWAKELSADTENEIILLGENVDIHNYKPSAEDIVTINSADVFVYTGGESEDWVWDTIDMTSDKIKVVSFMSALGPLVKEEAIALSGDGEGEGEVEYDEHTWLSPKNAEVIVNAMGTALSVADEDNRVIYAKNTEEYIKKLEELDGEYTDVLSRKDNKFMVFADRFPFRYLCDDYGIEYVAAFSGCSAETEASFETVKALAEAVDEHNLGTIYIIDGSDGKIAETVRENTSSKAQKIVPLNSMQAKQQGEAGYIPIMRDNLAILLLDFGL